MSHGITTSIRLSPELRVQLENTAHFLHRGKNWIIAKALEEYLCKINQNNLANEARRQSLLVSQKASQEEEDWEQNSDTSGWV